MSPEGSMQCSGVWFAGGRFGITWNLIQAQIRAPQRIGSSWMDDSDDDEAFAKVEAAEAVEAAFTVEAAVEDAVDDEDLLLQRRRRRLCGRRRRRAANF